MAAIGGRIMKQAIENLEKKLKQNIPARDDKSIQPGGHKLCQHGNDLRTFGLGGWPCVRCLRDLELAISEYLSDPDQ